MRFPRVTITLPQDLLRAADRLARRSGASRSGVIAQALRFFLDQSPAAARPGVVAEPRAPTYLAAPPLSDLDDAALLKELGHRLEQARGQASAESRTESPLGVDRERLGAICRRHHIRTLSLFGSVVTGRSGSESDVDILVEFEPGHTPGFAITDLEDELSAVFGGRPVDLVTLGSLHPLIRERVLASVVPLHGS